MADEATKTEPKIEPTSFKSAAKIGAKIRDLANKLKSSNDENATLKSSLATLTTKVTTLETEGTALKAAAANPSKDKQRVAELEKQIRDGKHRSAFARLATEAGAAPDLIDDLYERSGYTAEDDEPDDEALVEVVAEVKTKKPSAFAKPATDTAASVAAKPAKPVPAGGRGAPNNGKDGTIITAEHRIDPTFMLDKKNQKMIVDAAKEGRFR